MEVKVMERASRATPNDAVGMALDALDEVSERIRAEKKMEGSVSLC